MQKQCVELNIVSYNVCLNTLEKIQKWNLAFDLMKEIRLSGISMQAITYNTGPPRMCEEQKNKSW